MIPIAKPFLGEEEALAAREAILSGWVSQGPRVKEFEEEFAKLVGAKYACAVSSCTAALHLSLLAVGVKPGDVVITVSHSFIATANAVRYCNAEPVFVDIDPDSYNISPELLERFLTDDCEDSDGALYYRRVKELEKGESPLCDLKGSEKRPGRVAAIMPVHQMGMPCDMEAILTIAEQFNLPVVEDAACAIGSEIEFGGEWQKIGRPHGNTACFSFHPRKIITTGDGGIITTNDPEFDKKFRLLRQHAMSVPDTERHGARKVIIEEYVTTAFNYRMTDIQAAVGIEQLKRLPAIVIERRKIASYYAESLGSLPWLKIPTESVLVRTNYQSYPVRIIDTKRYSQITVMQRLLDSGVSTKRGIMNAHQEPAYSPSSFTLPESERARDETILLPLYPGMTEVDLEKVVDSIKKI